MYKAVLENVKKALYELYNEIVRYSMQNANSTLVFVHCFRSRIIIYRNYMLSSICNSSCRQVMGLVANITVCPFVTGHIRIII